MPGKATHRSAGGAECLFYPSAIGWDPHDDKDEKERQRNAWLMIQQAHAIANNLPVVTSNRVGFETDPDDTNKGTEFWGSSFISGQQGEILAMAPTDKPATIMAEIDTGRTDAVRRIWPYFRDRRIDAYHDIVKRHIE